ncbi:hypothetical protein TPHA_0B02880 [Tetrapisispora phaffii CBS 4417]|uniref:Nuclear segregation protein BFR1 n=1 Tax=Tetrapisispora phaffii (strain ATCC 24235 / CBS 4417 / NBRC 1672 / NRRL Y-8282 / UCD 70-5) TaxID=1071381 RepID=G8BPM9_TETPH|nr:hypothetical protein TPHA_0B02880 [Tetrapisispora phaffii CBS 4417]CCE61960.1 hypothetical protein TPHA_0B02880 [Tetrapisispora phaffii CBS 4417]
MSAESTHNKNNNNKIKRPDVAVRDRKLDTLNVQLKKIDNEIAILKKQIDQTQVNDVQQDERNKLNTKTKEIIKTQAELKTKRNAIFENIKLLDSQIKRKTAEIDEKLGSSSAAKKNKSRYNSAADIKLRLVEIDEAISSGELSLVEEKLLVKESQQLNKLQKDLSLVEPIKKSIEEDRSKIAEMKEELNAMNPKELSSQFDEAQKQLNALHEKTQGVYDKRNTLFNKRSLLYNKRDEIYQQIRKIRQDFDNEFKAFRSKLENERLKREEDEKLSKIIEEKEEKLSKLQDKLLHAKQPAFTFEIEAIENSLTVLDPSYVKPKKEIFEQESSLATSAPVRKVENDLVPIKKENDDIFYNTVPSKSKKFKKKNQNKQAQAATLSADGKFSLEPTLIATLAELDVTVPISQDDVSKTIEQLKKKHEDFVARQDEQTEKILLLQKRILLLLNFPTKKRKKQSRRNWKKRELLNKLKRKLKQLQLNISWLFNMFNLFSHAFHVA